MPRQHATLTTENLTNLSINSDNACRDLLRDIRNSHDKPTKAPLLLDALIKNEGNQRPYVMILFLEFPDLVELLDPENKKKLLEHLFNPSEKLADKEHCYQNLQLMFTSKKRHKNFNKMLAHLILTEHDIAPLFGLLESQQDFIRLVEYLASIPQLKKLLITFLTGNIVINNAIQANPTNITAITSQDQNIFKKVIAGLFDHHLLARLKDTNGIHFFIRHPEIAKVICEHNPKELAIAAGLIKHPNAKIRLLNECREFININHLEALSKTLLHPKDRINYFHYGKKDSTRKAPMDKIKALCTKAMNDSLEVEEKKLLLSFLQQDDIRGWLNLGKNPYQLGRLLINQLGNISSNTNVTLSKIIVSDPYLFSTLQSHFCTDMHKSDQLKDKSNILYAAVYMQEEIKKEKSFFPSRRQRLFIEKFIKNNMKIKGFTDEQNDAACWVIANNRELWGHLKSLYIPQRSWHSFFGPSTEKINTAIKKLGEMSKHFKDKLPNVTVITPAQTPTTAPSSSR